ncbi:MAG: hypothetical protein LBR91_03660, partial [Puniceicoccales bacterium]|nr:hypothetical protein [Puniceicoccales bacterium]
MKVKCPIENNNLSYQPNSNGNIIQRNSSASQIGNYGQNIDTSDGLGNRRGLYAQGGNLHPATQQYQNRLTPTPDNLAGFDIFVQNQQLEQQRQNLQNVDQPPQQQQLNNPPPPNQPRGEIILPPLPNRRPQGSRNQSPQQQQLNNPPPPDDRPLIDFSDRDNWPLAPDDRAAFNIFLQNQQQEEQRQNLQNVDQ